MGARHGPFDGRQTKAVSCANGPRRDDTLGVRVGERLSKYRIDNREDGDGGTDAKREHRATTGWRSKRLAGTDSQPRFGRSPQSALLSRWWAHLVGALRVHRINTAPTILHKDIEEIRQLGAVMLSVEPAVRKPGVRGANLAVVGQYW
jgi:hypothetical protein